MAFVVFKLEEGGRLVEMVYATQAEANSAAAGNAAWTAHTGNVNEDVNPGDFISSSGALLAAPPAAVRNVREGAEYRSQIQTEFNAWVGRRPTWLADIGSDNEESASTGALKQIYMMAALGDQIIAGNYLAGQSRTNRNSFVEHIVKAIRDDYREAYDRLLNASANVRNQWNSVSVADKAPVYSNIVTSTLGTPKDPDTSYTAVSGVTVPDNFDPSQNGLRRV